MENLMQVEVDCPMCGATSHVAMTIDEWNRLKENKEPIQKIFPRWSPADRELLITGMCRECQKKVFGE